MLYKSLLIDYHQGEYIDIYGWNSWRMISLLILDVYGQGKMVEYFFRFLVDWASSSVAVFD